MILVRDADISDKLAAQVREAAHTRLAVQIIGGGSKHFYGQSVTGAALNVSAHSGIVCYEPTELVITARAGTLLSTIEALLAQHGQMLPFEPPHFGTAATLGGTLACGFSGPRRPYAGAARDFVLGVKLLTGRGEILSFGGQVMKNVAGFDVARLMIGALGTLGILLEISLKVLPRPACEASLVFDSSPAQALETMNRWAGLPLPLSAAAYLDNRLYLRLSGSAAGVRAACAKSHEGTVLDGGLFWQDLREHSHAFFQGAGPLWRLSLPPATPPLALPGNGFIDWGGAQRWLRTTASPYEIREMAGISGGSAILFRGSSGAETVFQPLSPALAAVHRRIKLAFDPRGILNPGRLYADI